MTKTYFSTFLTGFADIVRVALKKDIPDIKIELLLDGLVVYKTDLPFQQIQYIHYLNNTYGLVHFQKNTTKLPFSELRDWIKHESGFRYALSQHVTPTDELRLILVQENKYIRLEKSFVESLCTLMKTKSSKPISRDRGNRELWFLVRREGYAFIGVRLTTHPDYEKTLKKGELRPELSHLMCLFAELSEEDIVVDPFAGSGSLIEQRRRLFPFKRLIASDGEKDKMFLLRKRFAGVEVEVLNADIFHLQERLGSSTVNKIITDPPWGQFGEKINIGVFYPKVLDTFIGLLKPKGVLVMLVSRMIDMDKLLKPLEDKLKLEKKIDTLVNGQKATVYKLVKIS